MYAIYQRGQSEKLSASRFDLEDLQSYTRVEEGTQQVIWTADDYEGNHRELKRQIKTKCVVQYKDNALLWLFPISIFQAFREIYILTFLFKGSCLGQYLLVNGLEYKMCHIENKDEGKVLVPDEQPLARRKQHIVDMLKIYEGRLNEIGNKRTALSTSWWKRCSAERRKLMDNAYNLLRNISGRRTAVKFSGLCLRATHTTIPLLFKATKTEGSERFLYLAPQVVRYLEVSVPEEFELGGKEPLSYSMMQRMCERIQKEIGFDEKITPRRFRTTVLTDLYDATKDVKQVQNAAGHTTAAMTFKHYIKGRGETQNTATPVANAYGLA